MKQILLILLLTIPVSFLYSQSEIIKDKKSLTVVCDKFMQTFSERRFYDAIQMLKQYSVIDQDQLDTLSYTVESQMGTIGVSYGKILSYDFVSEKNIKDYLTKKYMH